MTASTGTEPTAEAQRPAFGLLLPTRETTVTGQPELGPLLELAECLQAGRDFTGVAGLCQMIDGKLLQNPPAKPADDQHDRATQVLIVVSDFLRDYGLYLAIGIVITIVSFVYWLKNVDNRRRFHVAGRRIP